MTVKKLYIMNCFAPCYEKTRGYEQIFGQQGRMVGIRIYRSIFQLRYQLNKYLYVWCMGDIFQSRKRLYNHKCLFVRPFVRSSVRLKAKPFNNLKSSSFIILHSSFICLHHFLFILAFLHFATFKLFSLLISKKCKVMLIWWS